MSSRTDRPGYSLRKRLLLLMTLGFAGLLLIISLLLLSYARGAANRTYDLLLAGAALSIMERVSAGPAGPTVDLPYSAMEILALAPSERVLYRVFADDGTQITGMPDLPAAPHGPAEMQVFFDAAYRGTEFRFVQQRRQFSLPAGREWVTVQIGHTRDARQAQQLQLFINGMAGLAMVSAIGLGFVWLAIRHALRPLRQIETDLRGRDPGDLSPIHAAPPREIASLFESINAFMERLRSSRALTETFIADVAHQTRTSLSALHGQLSLAADAAELREMRRRVAKAEAQAQRTVRLTNQLLSHAMVIHRSEKASLHPVELKPLVRGQLGEMLRDSRMRDITLTFDDDVSGGRDVVMGDEISIREALRNLIENAVRHGPPDNCIDIDLRPGPGERVVLSVSDAGPGIPEDRRTEAVERFTSLARNTAGSGLGLAIVRAVADSHGADLQLGTSKAGGLRVALSFPVAPSGKAPRRPGLLVALILLAGLAGGGEARAQDPVLDLYAATDAWAMRPLIEDFEARNPDIHVDFREFQTVDLHRTLLGARPGSWPDLVISPAMDLQVDLVNRGLAQELELPDVRTLPDWASWRSELFGFTAEPAAMIYNMAAFRDLPLPETHQELASLIRANEDDLRGRIGAYDLHQSGIGYLYATQDLVQGSDAQRLVEVLSRADVRTFCCTSEMAARVASGELAMAVNVIGSYALDAARRNPKLGVHFFDDYNLVMARTAFVPTEAADPDLGARFIAYLLSPAGQRKIAQVRLLPILPVTTAVDPMAAALIEKAPSFLPIRLGPGLLTYLDPLKRRRFLESWQDTITFYP
ncbi:MAG: extracellular solute-binding protein [Pseudomonadota bacterium]|nr:extracellular solute-binding protein [Pseudomonadota bacterium]